MLDIKPIRVFLEVLERKSFSAAAQALQMTPASVTRIVSKLEQDLGQQLLLRTTRQVSVTSAGAVVAARYRPLLKEFDRAADELRRSMQPNRGRLAINTPMSFGLRVLPKMIESFKLAYPNVELVIRMTDHLVDIVEEDCDLSIRLSAPPTDKSTIWRRICDVPRFIVASKNFCNLHAYPNTPDDLDREFCLSYGHEAEPEVWKLSNGTETRIVTAGSDVISNNGDLLYNLVEADAGMALLPEFIVAEGMRQGKVEHVLTDWAPTPLTLSLFYPPYHTLPPLVATFTEFFEAYLEEVDGF